jgi:hypothetical protein
MIERPVIVFSAATLDESRIHNLTIVKDPDDGRAEATWLSIDTF